MTYPVYQDTGTTWGASTTSLTVDWPMHQVGDIGILAVESCGGEAVTLSTASGFTQITNSPQSTGTGTAGTRLTVFWCRATSGTMADVVIADAGDHVYSRGIQTFRGCKETGNPFDISAGSVKASASTSATIPAVTTTVGECLVLLMMTQDVTGHTTFVASTTNANFASIAGITEYGASSGNGGGYSLCVGQKAAAGSTGTTANTLDFSCVNAMMTLSLAPRTPVPSITAASDNFDNNSLASTWLLGNADDPTNVKEQNQRLELSHAVAGSVHQEIISSLSYDLTGSRAFVNITSAIDQSDAINSNGIQLNHYTTTNGGNAVWYRITSNNLSIIKMIDGTATQVGSNTAFNSSIHKWLSIREVSGTLYFDWSTNGTSWTNQASLTNLFGSALFWPLVYANINGTGHAYLDNFCTTGIVDESGTVAVATTVSSSGMRETLVFAGSASSTSTVVGDIDTSSLVTSSSAVTIVSSGTLRGSFKLQGTVGITTTISGSVLTARPVIGSSAPTITITDAGFTMTKPMVGSSSVTTTVPDAWPTEYGALTGTVTVLFASTGAANLDYVQLGGCVVTVALSGLLIGSFKMVGSLAVTFSSTGSLAKQGEILEFGGSGAVVGLGSVETLRTVAEVGSAALVVGVSGTVINDQPLSGTTIVVLLDIPTTILSREWFMVGTITLSGNIDGTLTLEEAQSGSTDMSITFFGTPTWEKSLSADLQVSIAFDDIFVERYQALIGSCIVTTQFNGLLRGNFILRGNTVSVSTTSFAYLGRLFYLEGHGDIITVARTVTALKKGIVVDGTFNIAFIVTAFVRMSEHLVGSSGYLVGLSGMPTLRAAVVGTTNMHMTTHGTEVRDQPLNGQLTSTVHTVGIIKRKLAVTGSSQVMFTAGGTEISKRLPVRGATAIVFHPSGNEGFNKSITGTVIAVVTGATGRLNRDKALVGVTQVTLVMNAHEQHGHAMHGDVAIAILVGA